MSPGLALAVLLAAGSPAAQKFVHVEGRELVAPDGAPLLLRGTNLGNWLVPEGYMFRFEKGPQSARQIDELLRELVGPEEARAFWKRYPATCGSRARTSST